MFYFIIIYAFGTAHVKHGSINQHVLQPCSTPEPGELINLAVLNIKCSASHVLNSLYIYIKFGS